MKYRILILLPAFLLITAPDIHAHNLVSATGSTQDHQHVYRHQQYGKPLQQGHRVQSSGGSGTVLWGSDMRPEYGKSSVRRQGPTIDGSKYGSAVNGYGKPVRGYGKPVQSYGKPRPPAIVK